MQLVANHATRLYQQSPSDLMPWLQKQKGLLDRIEPSLLRFEPGVYKRIRLAKTQALQIILIVWGTGADSGYKQERGCWMRVLAGTLYEFKKETVLRLAVDSVSFLKGSTGISRIVAHTSAVSLHIYALKPPGSSIYL
jgi:hypothetical protein